MIEGPYQLILLFSPTNVNSLVHLAKAMDYSVEVFMGAERRLCNNEKFVYFPYNPVQIDVSRS